MSLNQQQLKNIIEAALLTAGKPLPIEKLQALFSDQEQPSRDDIQAVLDELVNDYSGRGMQLKKVSSGYRIQATADMAPWLNQLSEEKTPRYTRALLETLALIAYRQPITRAGVEDIRGVSVSSNIVKTLLEREWIRVVGHRDVPGKPALYGTTRQFLDYFNLQSLSELPPLAELRSIEDIQQEFELNFTADATVESQDNVPHDMTEQAATPTAISAAAPDTVALANLLESEDTPSNSQTDDTMPLANEPIDVSQPNVPGSEHNDVFEAETETDDSNTQEMPETDDTVSLSATSH